MSKKSNKSLDTVDQSIENGVTDMEQLQDNQDNLEVTQESQDNAAQSKDTKKSNEYTVRATDGNDYVFNKRVTVNKVATANEDGSITVKLIANDGTVNESILNASTIMQFALFGATTKLANCFHTETDIEDAFSAVDELVVELNKGNWTRERKAGEGKGGSLIVQALVKVLGIPKADVVNFLSERTQAEKFALAASAEIKPVFEQLKAEKAAKKAEKDAKNGKGVDTSALFAGLAALKPATE